MKAAYEAYIVVLGEREGKRYAERKPLNVPVCIATDNLEKASDLQIREQLHDLLAEQSRREEQKKAAAAIADKCDGYDPFASQIRSRA